MALAEVAGPLTTALLRAALQRTCARHPLLRARLSRGPGGYVFALADGPPLLALQEELREPARERSCVERALAHDLDGREALARLTFLRDPDDARQRHLLLLSMHHAIADGMTMQLVIDELLRACAEAAPSIYSAEQRLAPSSESAEQRLAPSSESAEQHLALPSESAEQHLAPSIDSRLPAPAAGPPVTGAAPRARAYAAVVAAADRAPRVCQRELSPPLRAAFAARAREEAVSVNAGLAAAMLLAARCADEPPWAPSLTTAVNLRRAARPQVSPREVGCFIGLVRTCPAVAADSSLWAVARAYRDELQAQLSVPPAAVDFPALAGRITRAAIDGATQFKHHLGLSNLGLYPFAERHGPFALLRFRFATSQRSGAYVGFLQVVTFRQHMDLSFCYAEPLLPAAFADRYMDRLLQHLSHP